MGAQGSSQSRSTAKATSCWIGAGHPGTGAGHIPIWPPTLAACQSRPRHGKGRLKSTIAAPVRGAAVGYYVDPIVTRLHSLPCKPSELLVNLHCPDYIPTDTRGGG